MDDRVRLLRLLLAGAQVIIGAAWIVGALHDRQRPPGGRRFARSPRWGLIAGTVLALCGVAVIVLVSLQD